MARLISYVDLKFARLTQKFRDSLHNLITDCVSQFETYRHFLPDALTTHAWETSPSINKSQLRPGQSHTKIASHQPRCGRTVRRTVRRRLGPEAASLLNDYISHLQRGYSSLRVDAAQDRSFLRQELQLVGSSDEARGLDKNPFSIKNALLSRLHVRMGTHTLREISGLEDYSLGGQPTWDQSAVDFHLLLWSLQQIALEAIIRQILNIVEAHTLDSHLRWQYSKRIGEGWYAEWPNGHRPLSTTWPWNIKPSLFVLWGVCWMFYGSPDNNQRRTTRNPRGAAYLGENFRTGPLGNSSEPRRQQDLSETWAGPDLNTYPSHPWTHPTRAGVAQHASDPIPGDPSPTSYTTSVPSYSYISTPSSSSSDLYPTYCQSLNQVSTPAYVSSFSPWQTQSQFVPTGNLISTPQPTDQSNIIPPYAPRNQTANTGNPQGAVGSLVNFGSLRLGPLSDMQDYPSPGSSNSAQTASSYVSVLPSNALMPSPSIAEDTASRQSSRRSQEPPRNTEGLLCCNHAEHAQEQAPVFSRKCEWRKHMDKHERPYVCEEPECDNIRGFTYSGGLLRHQREVHRQHGGPKASCMCPYPDCKRHVGVGFSRKENLAEHLRRVHRDVDADQTQKEGPESAQNRSGTLTTRRKRRTTVRDDDSSDGDDLEHEVKKLKKQLQEKDDRLEKLERQVQLLVSGQRK